MLNWMSHYLHIDLYGFAAILILAMIKRALILPGPYEGEFQFNETHPEILASDESHVEECVLCLFNSDSPIRPLSIERYMNKL
jgi:hypothetical protein